MFNFLNRLRSNDGNSPDLEGLSHQVEEVRKLAIYDRETGLYAFWYLELRGDDECNRARRYESPLTLAIIDGEGGANSWAMQGVLTNWLRLHLRNVDVTGYLGDCRFVVVLTNTDVSGAQTILRRLQADVGGVIVSLSSLPGDGNNFETLYAAARARLAEVREATG